MDVFVYQAALWCEDCIKEILIKRHQAPKNLSPADTLANVLRLHDYESESDYDSDDLPKGPYPDGGGDADTPQHCDGCGLFLENPLTSDGYRYVNEKLIEHARDGSGDGEVLDSWARCYHAQICEPGQTTLEDLQFEYSMEDDEWGVCMGWWFTIAGELDTRGEPIPDEWRYKPGIHRVDPDDCNAVIVAGAPSEVLMRFMEDVEDDAKRLKAEGKDF